PMAPETSSKNCVTRRRATSGSDPATSAVEPTRSTNSTVASFRSTLQVSPHSSGVRHSHPRRSDVFQQDVSDATKTTFAVGRLAVDPTVAGELDAQLSERGKVSENLRQLVVGG